MLTPEYIKQEAHKPVYWSEEIGFDVVSFALAMEQNYSNRVGSTINGLRKEIKQLTAERDDYKQGFKEALKKHHPLLAKNAKLKAALEEATEFVDRHSEPWYMSGQTLLAKCREALKEKK